MTHPHPCVGLENIGNTCFINSFIQILRLLYPLNNALKNPRILAELNDLKTRESLLILEWNHLHTIINQQNDYSVVSPKRFIYFIREVARSKNRDDISSQNVQCDIVELFHFFFSDPEHSPTGRSMDFDVLWMGTEKPQHISEILSLDGKEILSTKTETYSLLNLEIPIDLGLSTISLYDCIDDYTCSEILDGENMWFNEKTRKFQSIQKRIRFVDFPRILFITLKRFTPDGNGKITQFVNYPPNELNINRYISKSATQYIYKLYGVVFHSGMLRGGHYTACTRNPFTDTWNFYDDSQCIKNVPLTTVISPNAYCLLYMR